MVRGVWWLIVYEMKERRLNKKEIDVAMVAVNHGLRRRGGRSIRDVSRSSGCSLYGQKRKRERAVRACLSKRESQRKG